MIISFADEETQLVFNGERSRKLPFDIQKAAARKLDIIHQAIVLRNISNLPGNRFEKLSGDLEGQYSIRINDQWRICFNWVQPNAVNVRITDYH
jgi:proteic killer suppression protein